MGKIFNMIFEYIKKTLRIDNRKVFDGDSNGKYRIKIELSEVGPDKNHYDEFAGNFYFEIKVPRQVDNNLGNTLSEVIYSREKAIDMLENIIEELKKCYCIEGYTCKEHCEDYQIQEDEFNRD